MKKCFLLMALAAVLCFSCATIEKPEIQVLPEKQPEVSKVLTKEAPQRFLKRKVAIARFSNETKYGQSFFLDKDQDFVGKQAMDILSARLAATEKFILLERADFDKINRELERGNLASLKIPADFLIVGSVSEFGRKVTGEVGVFSRTKRQTAYAKVNIRLVDIHTGQIVYSEEGEGEAFSEAGTVLGVGGVAGYDATLNDKVISAAISKLVNNVVENLLHKPWRSYILAYQGGSYIIAGGKAQGIREGDSFGVYRKGPRVTNPQTGIPIDLPGTLLGTVRVNTTTGDDPRSEVSLCSVVSGSLPTENFDGLFVQEQTRP